MTVRDQAAKSSIRKSSLDCVADFSGARPPLALRGNARFGATASSPSTTIISPGGQYGTKHRRAIPRYLKEENFPILKSSFGRVKAHLTSMTGFLATLPASSLNRFVMLDAQAWFGVPAFDHLFFSYSLSMIPTWAAALEAAMANLKPGGEIWVVDFWDQAGHPWPFAKLLGVLTIEPVGSRYAYLARFIKRD